MINNIILQIKHYGMYKRIFNCIMRLSLDRNCVVPSLDPIVKNGPITRFNNVFFFRIFVDSLQLRMSGVRVRYLSFCAQYVPLLLTRSVEGDIMLNFKFHKSCFSFGLVLKFFWWPYG